MLKLIEDFFKSEKIEYYSVLSYSDCREIAPNIMERESFVPRSVIIFLIPYYAGEAENISRYATAYDYHICIEEISARLIARLKESYPEAHFRGYGDHSPIDERSAALVSGLGIVGKNGLLINEKYGSYVFVADVVSDLSPDVLGAKEAGAVKCCENCGICYESCPTGILCGKGDTCLSFITQKKGELTESEKALMIKYNTAWGCDECQRYCPHNLNPEKTPIEFFYKNRIEKLTKEVLFAMDKEEFKKRAFAWRGRKTVERNLDILNE